MHHLHVFIDYLDKVVSFYALSIFFNLSILLLNPCPILCFGQFRVYFDNSFGIGSFIKIKIRSLVKYGKEFTEYSFSFATPGTSQGHRDVLYHA